LDASLELWIVIRKIGQRKIATAGGEVWCSLVYMRKVSRYYENQYRGIYTPEKSFPISEYGTIYAIL
jgi:hypothetical protein